MTISELVAKLVLVGTEKGNLPVYIWVTDAQVKSVDFCAVEISVVDGEELPVRIELH